MMGLDKDKNAVGDSKNFKYLNLLIHRGAKDIVLDSDIVLDDDEESKYKEGIKLDVDDFIIDGNGHTIDARAKTRIFDCTGKCITIKNIILKNGFAESGGAIRNNGELCIIDSSLTENAAWGPGGAIFNDYGKLTITGSTLSGNNADDGDYAGGAIFNNGGELTITGSTLSGNAAVDDGGAICNVGSLYDLSELTITGSTITGNTSHAGSGGAVYNGYGKLIVAESTITGNTGGVYAIYNDDGVLCIIDSTFAENTAAGECKDIYNHGIIVIEEDASKIMRMHNEGSLYPQKSLENGQKDFTYLNELINAETNEIKLENDIVLNIANNEQKTFENGIEIDRDNLVIDGNGHTIDAQCLTRIFNCRAENVTMKNITLKNGFAKRGGAIYNREGELTIIESTLTGNTSQGNGPSDGGGAIYNMGELTITGSTLTGNAAQGFATYDDGGGAIYSYGKLTVTGSTLSGNTAEDEGGAIYNDGGELTITESTLLGNTTKDGGGAVYNDGGVLCIMDSTFAENTAEDEGGAISNSLGVLTIIRSTLSGNTALDKGGAIYSYTDYRSYSRGHKSKNCTFKDNIPDDVFEIK